MAQLPFGVKHFVKISKSRIIKDGDLFWDSSTELFSDFADEAYRYLNTGYPKFHKMDHLSKLGFLAAEVLLADEQLKERYSPDKMGVILANKNASLDTDVKYSNLLKEGKASPAVFVYTLPNIVIGEISIRHGFKGENTFFIADEYQSKSQVSYINTLFACDVIDVCIGGWVELMGNDYECFMYVAERNPIRQTGMFTEENITNWYKKEN